MLHGRNYSHARVQDQRELNTKFKVGPLDVILAATLCQVNAYPCKLQCYALPRARNGPDVHLSQMGSHLRAPTSAPCLFVNKLVEIQVSQHWCCSGFEVLGERFIRLCVASATPWRWAAVCPQGALHQRANNEAVCFGNDHA